MTTITIDTPLDLTKTHFANPLEAAYALMGAQIKSSRNNSGSMKTVKERYLENTNIISMPDSIKTPEEFADFIQSNIA